MIPQPEDGGVRAHAPNTSHAQSGSVNIRRAIASSLPTPNSTQITAAGAYIALGWAVIPCCRLAPGDPPQCSAERAGYDQHKGCPKPGKMATRKWQGRAATSPAEAKTWWRYGNDSHGPNMALLMGPGRLIALDVDGPAGDARLAEAEAILGQLPDTLENITGRADGGRHLLFTLPDDATDAEVKALTKSVAGLRIDGQRLVVDASSPGLDLRAGDPDAGRSYILVAPSVHPSGARYQWRGGPIAELPRAWFDALPREALAKPRKAIVRRGNALVVDDPDAAPGAMVELLPLPPGQRLSPWFEKVLAGEVASVRGAADGTRNDTLNTSTLRVWRVAQAAGVPRAQVEAVMVEAGVAAGLSEGEVALTVAGALNKGDAAGPAVIPDRPKPNEQTAGQGRREVEPTQERTADVADIAELELVKPPAAPPDNDPPLKVVDIRVGPLLAKVTDAAVDALGRHPDVYQRAGIGLARIIEAVEPPGVTESQQQRLPPSGSLVIEAVQNATVTEWLTTVARWISEDENGKIHVVQPQKPVVAAVVARRVYPPRTVRPLAGIIEAPSLRRDGSVITAPGYDRVTGLYLRWRGAPIEVPESPTRDDARAAFQRLTDLFADFTFQGDDDARLVMLSACVAAILTPLARAAIDGPTPAFMWTADAKLAGKSLLASTCGAIVLGRVPSARQYTPDDDEMAKRIAAVALNGLPIWMLDNVKNRIDGGMLELALTSHDTIAARILGHTEDREMPWRSTVYLTGNGATYSDDMSRRLLHIALLSRARVEGVVTASSEARTFRYPELVSHVLDHRPALLRDALTILRAHVVAGRPSSGQTLPSYEAWARVVAHAAWWASGTDPQRARPPESASGDTDAALRVALAWEALFQTARHTLATMRAQLKGEASGLDVAAELTAALADLAGAADLAKVSPGSLGRWFEQHVVGRVFPDPNGGTVCIVADGVSHGSKRYRAEHRGSVTALLAPEATPVEGGEVAGQKGGVGGVGGVLPVTGWNAFEVEAAEGVERYSA